MTLPPWAVAIADRTEAEVKTIVATTAAIFEALREVGFDREEAYGLTHLLVQSMTKCD